MISLSHLPGTVATIDDDISPRSVGASVTAQVYISTLQLLGLAITAHWDHGLPQILSLLVNEVRESGIDVPGRDGVDTSKVAPLIGERPRHVDAAGFGNVV